MAEKVTPQEARKYLLNLGIDDDSYGTVMNGHPSLDGLTGHELKVAVRIATSSEPQDYNEVYKQVRRDYPEGRRKR